ncbi:MAG: gluconokinase [Gammaproteobacteria bacterium]
MSDAVVIMGVSGCGKSTLGRALAAALDWRFVEGDALHPPANIVKMAAGIPLQDEDRWPFLEHVAQAIIAGRPSGMVVSCSALKRSYRDFLRERVGKVTFLLPVTDRERLVARLAQRPHHFMPVSLLDSQLATLESPAADEAAILVDGAAATDAQVAYVLAALRSRGSAPVVE